MLTIEAKANLPVFILFLVFYLIFSLYDDWAPSYLISRLIKGAILTFSFMISAIDLAGVKSGYTTYNLLIFLIMIYAMELIDTMVELHEHNKNIPKE